MAKDIHDPKSVTEFIQKLKPEIGKIIETIRQFILNTDNAVGEQIKWNSPSFFYQGEMKPFNPKEYKRDIVVLNIRKGTALPVFPTGATIKDTSGILEGNYEDGRRMVTLKNMEEVKTKGKNLQKLIQEWLNQVDKPE